MQQTFYTFYPIRICPFNEDVERGWKVRKEIEVVGCDYDKRLDVIVNQSYLYSIHGSYVLKEATDSHDGSKAFTYYDICTVVVGITGVVARIRSAAQKQNIQEPDGIADVVAVIPVAVAPGEGPVGES